MRVNVGKSIVYLVRTSRKIHKLIMKNFIVNKDRFSSYFHSFLTLMFTSLFFKTFANHSECVSLLQLPLTGSRNVHQLSLARHPQEGDALGPASRSERNTTTHHRGLRMLVKCAFVREETYYRNDPLKYDLTVGLQL